MGELVKSRVAGCSTQQEPITKGTSKKVSRDSIDLLVITHL